MMMILSKITKWIIQIILSPSFISVLLAMIIFIGTIFVKG